MRQLRRIALLLCIGGCRASAPELPRHPDLGPPVVVESAGAIDPASFLLEIHADGRLSSKGAALSPDQLCAEIAAAPVLLDVDPEARFDVVRDALSILMGRCKCSGFAFLVLSSGRRAALGLPVVVDKGLGYRVREGRGPEQVLDGLGSRKHLELLVIVGIDGAVDVRAVNFCVPGAETALYFPPAGDPQREAPEVAWKGERPPLGFWTPEVLRAFVSRRDVKELSPFILLKITTREKAPDVLRCLSTLKSAGVIVVPEIPARP